MFIYNFIYNEGWKRIERDEFRDNGYQWKIVLISHSNCRDADWNQAFNFSSDLGFLASCIKKTRGKKIHLFFLSFLSFSYSSFISVHVFIFLCMIVIVKFIFLNRLCSLTQGPKYPPAGWLSLIFSLQNCRNRALINID